MSLMLVTSYAIFTLAFAWVALSRLKTPKPVKAPEYAQALGPNEYMKVWTEGARIKMVFRNMPHVTVMFDKRVSAEFSEWLSKI